MYHAIDVAKYVIWFCEKQDRIITKETLQRLLYFIQADFLVTKDRPCFEDPVYAWDIGPVIKEVWLEYRKFGASYLTSSLILPESFDPSYISKEYREEIDGMILEVLRYSESTLANIVMRQPPFYHALDCHLRGTDKYDSEISLVELKEFFK